MLLCRWLPNVLSLKLRCFCKEAKVSVIQSVWKVSQRVCLFPPSAEAHTAHKWWLALSLALIACKPYINISESDQPSFLTFSWQLCPDSEQKGLLGNQPCPPGMLACIEVAWPSQISGPWLVIWALSLARLSSVSQALNICWAKASHCQMNGIYWSLE